MEEGEKKKTQSEIILKEALFHIYICIYTYLYIYIWTYPHTYYLSVLQSTLGAHMQKRYCSSRHVTAVSSD